MRLGRRTPGGAHWEAAFSSRFITTAIGVILAVASLLASIETEAAAPVAGTNRGVLRVERFDVSGAVRDLPVAPQADLGQPPVERRSDLPTGLEGPLGPQDTDPIVQRSVGQSPDIPSTLVSFDAISSTGVYPPDTNGEVGPNHYVQMVNSKYAVYSKSGSLLAGPFNINTLWSGFGGACETENAGDPVVVYDQFVDRWILMQFTAAGPTYYLCVALSTTGDPASSFYRWAFSTGSNFPDYPKFAVWSDAYLASTREFASSSFQGIGAYAFSKAQMVAGNPSPTVISFLAPTSPSYLSGDGLLPADIDGWTWPPTGAPGYFVGSQDNGGPYGAPSDALNIWKLSYNFANPPASSFVHANTVATSAFDSMLAACGGTRNCVPQPGTAQRIDHQGYRQRVLHRAAYRNFGTHEAIVTNQSIEASAMSGIRWWEIRSPNASPTIYQEGTYAPGTTDGIHRWFGSAAQDKYGDMALGYSVSDGISTYPGIRYTGRLAADTLGTLPQGEGVIVNGGGSQTGSAARWGDYSSMTVDPNDDCTFWYTTEYYATTSATGWKTRVGSFKFPHCKVAGGTQRAYVSATAGNDANASLYCPATAPCRWFQTALEVVESGGEVVAMHSGAYGAAVVTRSVSLTAAPGVHAGISVFTGNGVTIGTPGVNVILRGISIVGAGGSNGIYMNAGAKLSIENCAISNFSAGNGIFASGAAKLNITNTLLHDNQVGVTVRDGIKATITKSKLRGNTANGILALGVVADSNTSIEISRSVVQGNGADWGISSQSLWATAGVKAFITRSAVSNSGTGIAVTGSGPSTVVLNRTRVSGNATGLYQSGAGAILKSLGNNTLTGNGTNASGSISSIPFM
ncbi:MAG: right-handed parallel beta-helix repeat-containing protein [Burkholderiales bacterium]|nr:MAG: right-handed parallel beta-helix repeat-containing protein [Burkholderiales bacterium]